MFTIFDRRRKLGLVITTVITIVLLTSLSVFSCTGIIAVGDAVEGPNIWGQTHDRSYPGWDQYISMRVFEETGIKIIGVGTEERLNSYGVSRGSLARATLPGTTGHGRPYVDADEGYLVEYGFSKEDYPDVKVRSSAWILERATSAKEAVEMQIEGLPPGTYNVLGPLTDTALGHANTFIFKPFLKYSTDPLYSLNRQERVQELLDLRRDEQFNNYTQITALYAFEIFRDRQYEEEYSRMHENRGNISRFTEDSGTHHAVLNELPSEHRDLLSIHWVALNYPPISPFMPFYIGLPEIPPTFAKGPENEVNVFQELFNAVCYKMDYMDDVQKFWEAFEFQTVREKREIEKEVRQLADEGCREEAQSVLYDFVNKKCELAVAYAKDLTKLIVNGMAINEIKIDVSSPVYYQEN